MESNWMIPAVTGGTTGVIVGVMYALYKCFKKSSCRSNCCGLKSSMSVDLEKGLDSSSKEIGFKKEIII